MCSTNYAEVPVTVITLNIIVTHSYHIRRDDARGLIVGLTGFNTKAHIVRAALEAAAFQVS